MFNIIMIILLVAIVLILGFCILMIYLVDKKRKYIKQKEYQVLIIDNSDGEDFLEIYRSCKTKEEAKEIAKIINKVAINKKAIVVSLKEDQANGLKKGSK